MSAETMLFDQEYATEMYEHELFEEGKKQGIEQGMQQGMEKGIQQILKYVTLYRSHKISLEKALTDLNLKEKDFLTLVNM